MDLFHRLYTFLNYQLNGLDEHSLHSPFLYKLYTTCIIKAKRDPVFEDIDRIRNSLSGRKNKVIRNDPGTGPGTSTKISKIVQRSLLKPKYVRLLCQLSLFFNAKGLLELGTSFGLTTAYLAATQPGSKIYTFEGDTSLLPITRDILNPYKNTSIIEGDIRNTLIDFSLSDKKIDMAFIDATHTFEATIHYYNTICHEFDPRLVILDDIYWSRPMTRAWNMIVESEPDALILDLYRMGIIIRGTDIPTGVFYLEF